MVKRDDDAFLNALSLGKDPSQGEDELAGLLLELRDEVHQPMPQVPLGALAGATGSGAESGVDNGAAGAEASGGTVISLEPARSRRRRPLMHGLIGAAAATLLIAGSGTAIFNAGPDSPLAGIQAAVFGSQDADSVELASKLEEIDSRVASGDMDGTRQLLEEARKLVRSREGAAQAESKDSPVVRSTTTVTRSPEPGAAPAPVSVPPAASPSAETVTVTAVETETVYVTTTPGSSTRPVTPTSTAPEPTDPAEPSDSADPAHGGGTDGHTPTP